jgi:hypothetical protein
MDLFRSKNNKEFSIVKNIQLKVEKTDHKYQKHQSFKKCTNKDF